VITRVFDAPRRLVFDAWTKCEHLRHWMLGPDGWSMTICEIDLRPGGAQRLGWRHTDGSVMEIRSVYKEVVPPEKLVATESWGGKWPDTLITHRLTEENGRTTATITMLYPSKEARDMALQSGMKEGMALSYNRLEAYLQAKI
jgi:uncharacterized protein YndB with AHSA1/START domain